MSFCFTVPTDLFLPESIIKVAFKKAFPLPQGQKRTTRERCSTWSLCATLPSPDTSRPHTSMTLSRQSSGRGPTSLWGPRPISCSKGMGPQGAGSHPTPIYQKCHIVSQNHNLLLRSAHKLDVFLMHLSIFNDHSSFSVIYISGTVNHMILATCLCMETVVIGLDMLAIMWYTSCMHEQRADPSTTGKLHVY